MPFKLKIKSFPTVDLGRGGEGEQSERGRDGESIVFKNKDNVEMV